MTLRLVATLGPNVDEICQRIVEALTDAGLVCHFDRSQGHQARVETITGGGADLMWMCGLLTAQLMKGGTVDGVILGAPVFDAETEPVYRSVFVARDGDSRPLTSHFVSSIWAMNEPGSWSGHHVVHRHAADNRFTGVDAGRIRWSGSHVQSLEMVRTGEADIAPIDVTIWRWSGVDTSGLTPLGVTRDWPSPPLVLSAAAGVSIESVSSVLGGLTVPGLQGIRATDIEAYNDLLAVR